MPNEDGFRHISKEEGLNYRNRMLRAIGNELLKKDIDHDLEDDQEDILEAIKQFEEWEAAGWCDSEKPNSYFLTLAKKALIKQVVNT